MSTKERKRLRELNPVDRFLFDGSMEEPEVYRAGLPVRRSIEYMKRSRGSACPRRWE